MARSDAAAGAAISGDGCLHTAAKATETAATGAIRRHPPHSGQAAAPPSNDRNVRRVMLDIGLPSSRSGGKRVAREMRRHAAGLRRR